jgi:iduronate 2-sulfatase
LYPQQNGVTGNGSSEKLTKTLGKRPTLPEYFKQSGWHTARVSKIYHMRVPGDITAGVDGPDHAMRRRGVRSTTVARRSG